MQSEVPLELAAKKVFLQGFDHVGRPVVVIWASRHAMGHLEESKRFICYVLDNATAAAELRQNPLGQILVLFDLSGTLLDVAIGSNPVQQRFCRIPGKYFIEVHVVP